jgi:hypothetical protein
MKRKNTTMPRFSINHANISQIPVHIQKDVKEKGGVRRLV